MVFNLFYIHLNTEKIGCKKIKKNHSDNKWQIYLQPRMDFDCANIAHISFLFL